MSIRFLADMGVSIRCIEWLRVQGYDAVHLSEQKLHKLTDSGVLKKAKNEDRTLLTMDLDFVQIKEMEVFHLNKKIALEFVNAINSHDINKIIALTADDHRQ